MSPQSIRHRLAFALVTALLPATGGAVDAEALQGNWCLLDAAATDSERVRAIEREWSFLEGGVLRVQSEVNDDLRMSVDYRLADRRLDIPELDLALRIEDFGDGRMSALSDGGRVQYNFARGGCDGIDSDADSDGGVGSAADDARP